MNIDVNDGISLYFCGNPWHEILGKICIKAYACE